MIKKFIVTAILGLLSLFGGAPESNQKLGSTNYVQTQYFTLAGSGASIGATSLVLSSFKDFTDGSNLTMSDFGTQGFGTIEPNNGTQEESIAFTGVTQNANGTATLTGVTKCAVKSPYTQTSGIGVTHPGGVKFVISNTACFYNTFANKSNNETVTGAWTFNQHPVSSSTSQTFLSNQTYATQAYVNNVGAGGFTAANVSNTQGTFALGTSPETVGIRPSTTLGMALDAAGNFYQKTSSTLAVETDSNGIKINTSTLVSLIATTTPTAGKIPLWQSNGQLSVSSSPVTSTDAASKAYVDLGLSSSKLIYASSSQISITDSVNTEQSWVATTTIPTSTIATSTALRFRILVSSLTLGNTQTITIKIKFGGTTQTFTSDGAAGTASVAGIIESTIFGAGASSQRMTSRFQLTGNTTIRNVPTQTWYNTTVSTPAENSNSPIALSVTATWNTVSASSVATIDGYTVEILR